MSWKHASLCSFVYKYKLHEVLRLWIHYDALEIANVIHDIHLRDSMIHLKYLFIPRIKISNYVK